jgi:ABC-type Fe3+/spermidine/putrescine transport system ATPase subunit
MSSSIAPLGIRPQVNAGGATESGTLDAELRSVRKVFRDGTVAMNGISFAVSRGEFFSILGPSGCGKTTTLRVIAGLELPDGGEVLVRGEPMGSRSAHRRPTNTVFQRPALFPHLSVEANVAFGLKIDGVPRRERHARVAEALELVDLGAYGRRRPHELSGGQQQRVAIARALVKKPAVLLLDEPLSALDLRLREQMQEALKRIQSESSTTFIYVTHNQAEAFAMSDRIALMRAGRIEQIGSPVDIYHQPRSRFVASFVGDTNIFEGTVDGSGTLTCEDGFRLALPRPAPVALLRPERIEVGPLLPDRPGWNTYRAVVEEVVFQGPTVRCRVRVDGHSILVQRPAEETSLGVGQGVMVGWSIESVVTLTEDSAADER